MLDMLKSEVNMNRNARVPLIITVLRMTLGIEWAEFDVSSLRWIAPSKPKYS